MRREAALAAVFVIASIVTIAGTLAPDVHLLTLLGAPIALTSFALSKSKLGILATLCAFVALRFLFALIITVDPRALIGFVLSACTAGLLLRIAAERESKQGGKRERDSQIR